MARKAATPRSVAALPPVTEAQWSKVVRDYLDACGWEYVSFEAPFAAIRKLTVLDIYAWRARRQVWIELKRDGKEATPTQQAFIDSHKDAGLEAYCWTPSDWDAVEERLR
jgi:hypothetical protein